jgi:hypothetical protein
VVSIEMDQPLKKAYEDLEEDIKKALREHRGNQSVISVTLNALLAYPDRPFDFGDLIGREFNPDRGHSRPGSEPRLRQGTASGEGGESLA